MTYIHRSAGETSLIDVLDRVLDKGIVIDAWVHVSLMGISLLALEARVVVASIETYLKHAETAPAALGHAALGSGKKASATTVGIFRAPSLAGEPENKPLLPRTSSNRPVHVFPKKVH